MISHAASTVTKSWRSGTAFVEESGQAGYVCFQAYLSRNIFLLKDFCFSKKNQTVIQVGISKRKCYSLFQKKCPIPGVWFQKNILVGSGIVVWAWLITGFLTAVLFSEGWDFQKLISLQNHFTKKKKRKIWGFHSAFFSSINSQYNK